MAKKKKPLPSIEWLKPRLTVTRLITNLTFAGLIALLLVWNTWVEPLPEKLFWPVMAMQLIPLALLAPGVFLGHARGHAWACFVINLYFMQGVLAAFDPSRHVFGWIESILTFVFFCAALLYIRWRFQFDRKMAGEV